MKFARFQTAAESPRYCKLELETQGTSAVASVGAADHRARPRRGCWPCRQGRCCQVFRPAPASSSAPVHLLDDTRARGNFGGSRIAPHGHSSSSAGRAASISTSRATHDPTTVLVLCTQKAHDVGHAFTPRRRRRRPARHLSGRPLPLSRCRLPPERCRPLC